MNTRRMGMSGWVLCVATLAVSLGFSACAKAEPPIAAGTPVQPEAAAPPPASPQSPTAQGAPDTQLAAQSERKVIHKAELTLSAEDVRGTADQLVTVVTAAQGYVAQRDEHHADSHVVQSSLSLRVPAAHFERVLRELKACAAVVEERITGNDVTEEFSDVSARLRTLATLEERLLTLTSARDALKDVLEVERELQRVRSEIERLSGRKQWLENQTAFASIELRVLSPEQPVVGGTESTSSRFVNAVSDGLESAIDVTAGLIRIGLTLAPFVPLVVLGVLVYRGLRRRRSAQIKA